MSTEFNPSAPATAHAGIFGLSCTADEAQIILIPINWELTVSYGKGTSTGPEAIKKASMQIDLHHHDYPDLWQKGLWMDQFPVELKQLHDSLLPDSETIIKAIEDGSMEANPAVFKDAYARVNQGAEQLNAWLANRIAYWKEKGKTVGLIGGDHSIPLGYHTYLSRCNEDYAILAIDAHMDLRRAYEGFTFSHASIFYNALKFNTVSQLVLVGIRDFCHEEVEYIAANGNTVQVFYDRELRKQQFEGKNWMQVCDQIIAALPEKVYLSVDIDGLDPALCPHTGTAVPGGLQFEELAYLLNRLKASGKTCLGFDLCEVAPNPLNPDDEWDGNVAARVLFQLCGIVL